MKTEVNSAVRTAANNIVARMKYLTEDNFEFTWELTADGIVFTSDDYFVFQDSGVKGTESGSSKEGFAYKDKMPPPSAFSKYTNDSKIQFAMAKSKQQKGTKAQNYSKKFADDTYILIQLETIYAEFIEQI